MPEANTQIPIHGTDRFATCDPSDHEYLSQFEWHAQENGSIYREVPIGDYKLRLYMSSEVVIRHRQLPQFKGLMKDYPTAIEQVLWALERGLNRTE